MDLVAGLDWGNGKEMISLFMAWVGGGSLADRGSTVQIPRSGIRQFVGFTLYNNYEVCDVHWKKGQQLTDKLVGSSAKQSLHTGSVS
jgi:hypothetical protein